MAILDATRRSIRIALRLVAPLAVGVVFVVCVRHAYWRAAAWGLVMLLSMDGWGRLVQHLVRPRRPLDLGLSMAWGAAATLVTGGLLCALHLAVRPVLLAQLILGCLLSVAGRIRSWNPAPSRGRVLATLARPNTYLVLLAALFPVTLDYLGEIGDTKLNQSDDPPFYFYLSEKIVQTGTPFDPFLSRRVATMGGEDYLLAQFLTMCRADQLNVVDGGVGLLLLLAMLVGAVAPRGLRRANAGHLAIPLFLFVVLGECRINVASLLTGASLFFAVYRTILWLEDETPARAALPVRYLAVLAGCIVATCTLRMSNAIPVAAFASLAVLGRHLRLPVGRAAVTTALRDVLLLGAACFALLLPWLVVSHESTGALIYPLDKGNVTPGFALLKTESGFEYNGKHLVENLGYLRPISASMLLLTAGMLPHFWRGGRRARSPRDYVPLLSAVCLCALCFMAYMGGDFEDWVNSRYYYAVMVATAMAIAVSIVPRTGVPRDFAASPRATLVVAVLVAQAVFMREVWTKTYLNRVEIIDRAKKKAGEEQSNEMRTTQAYRAWQGHVPAGEAIAVVVNEPYRFDMRRNQIFFLDIGPGGLGPKPGFPVFKGPDALAEYLLAHRVRYLITGSFHDRINIDTWRSNLHKEHSYEGYEAPIAVDTLESLEKLEKSRRVVFEEGATKVIDLADGRGS